ncbi:MAG: FMN-binding protein [Planctomycetes bacterium]|jgi:electron transport complex protein RnfG|nr:FMN-binding protein [Planctomycetota bacterium]
MINYIKQGWLVLVLGLAFGAALGGVQVWLGPTIDANRLNETFGQVPKLVCGASAEVSLAKYRERLAETSGERASHVDVGDSKITVYDAYDAEENLVGYVVRGSGAGYGDTIIALIGLNRDASTITGVYVLSQKETPGLGSRIADSSWNSQYDGKATEPPLEVVKKAPAEPNDIQAISGATISSNALTNIVNGTVEDFRRALQASGSGTRKGGDHGD